MSPVESIMLSFGDQIFDIRLLFFEVKQTQASLQVEEINKRHLNLVDQTGRKQV